MQICWSEDHFSRQKGIQPSNCLCLQPDPKDRHTSETLFKGQSSAVEDWNYRRCVIQRESRIQQSNICTSYSQYQVQLQVCSWKNGQKLQKYYRTAVRTSQLAVINLIKTNNLMEKLGQGSNVVLLHNQSSFQRFLTIKTIIHSSDIISVCQQLRLI